MITDMERIRDQSADISEIVIFLSGAPISSPWTYCPRWRMPPWAWSPTDIDAFCAAGFGKWPRVIRADDVVDDCLFSAVREELTGLIREDSANGSQALDFLMIAKYFERIGDHAVNIAGMGGIRHYRRPSHRGRKQRRTYDLLCGGDDVNIRELVIYTWKKKRPPCPGVLPMGRRFGRPCRPSSRTWSAGHHAARGGWVGHLTAAAPGRIPLSCPSSCSPPRGPNTIR